MAEQAADAGKGGTGAPPAVNEANRAPSDLTREYENRDIRVQWFAGRCVHVASCIKKLPGVFDPKRRPWIDLNRDGATADAVAAAVEACPTGALHYERLDGGPQEIVPPVVRAKTIPNGPVLLHGGPIEFVDANGEVIRRDSRVAVCSCGKSQHMPFCDNSHRAKG